MSTVPVLVAAMRTAPVAVTVAPATVACVSRLMVVVTSRRPNSRKSASTVPVGLS